MPTKTSMTRHTAAHKGYPFQASAADVAYSNAWMGRIGLHQIERPHVSIPVSRCMMRRDSKVNPMAAAARQRAQMRAQRTGDAYTKQARARRNGTQSHKNTCG